ncbi:hypothetical protein OC844_004278 [Tilletia horrida]|nr:hypothetical protein OC844_004278 [Tilletia horrida]
MHALHLGACKRFFHLTLIEGGLLQLDRRGELPVLADVLKSATYPRGVTRIRANFGLRSAGSPTADAWSTFTRYMLPAVLASHWADELASDSTATFTTTNAHLRSQGQPSFRTTVRIRDILVTSVDLCRVTHLAQRRSISADELDQMEASIDRHIKAMATMIDVRWPVPNHHALTHLPEHIRRFGPARCFWFYTQERLNGFLKKTMHNQKQSGELESTMQTNHEMYRCTRRALNGLDTSGPELVFRNIMEAHNVSLDNEEEDDELEHRAAMCPVPYLHGSDWEAALEPSTTRAIAAFINNTRTALDLVAVPVQEWDGSTPATLVGAEATFFQHIIVHGTNVTVRLARTNTPPGATFVLVRTTTDLRLAQVVSAFEHTYAQSQTGELVRRQYALVDVYRPIAWPASHPLGGPSAQSIGYLLCTTIDPYRTVTPLANILDACVTMTAKYITGNEDTLLAARLRP